MRRVYADGGDVGAKGGEANVKDVQELKRQKQKLEEENNMLKYKMEVLIGAVHTSRLPLLEWPSLTVDVCTAFAAHDRHAGGGRTGPQKDGGQA